MFCFLTPSTPHYPPPPPSPIFFIIRMSHCLLDPGDLPTLEYIVTHVFFPVQLPGGDDRSIRHDCSLAGAITSVLRLYSGHVSKADMPQWHSISQMLDNLRAIVQFEGLDRSQTISQLGGMNVGGKFPTLRSILETHNV